MHVIISAAVRQCQSHKGLESVSYELPDFQLNALRDKEDIRGGTFWTPWPRCLDEPLYQPVSHPYEPQFLRLDDARSEI